MTTNSPIKRNRQFGGNPQKKHFGKGNFRRNFLEPGIKGFLATCNFNERDCIKESFNILNEYADQLYGPSENKAAVKTSAELTEKKNPFQDQPKTSDLVEPSPTDDAGCIEDELQKALDSVRQKDKKGANPNRFDSVDSGATNTVFIKTTLADPVELGYKIVTDIFATKEKKTRHLLRLVPIEAVCRTKMSDILDAAGVLFDKYFLHEPKTYSIVFNHRYNNDVKREDVIKQLADLVAFKNIKNSVNLKNPEVSIIVEVIKGLCLLSVVPQYLQMKKYNLLEIASPSIPKREFEVEATAENGDDKSMISSKDLLDTPAKDNAAEDSVNDCT